MSGHCCARAKPDNTRSPKKRERRSRHCENVSYLGTTELLWEKLGISQIKISMGMYIVLSPVTTTKIRHFRKICLHPTESQDRGVYMEIDSIVIFCRDFGMQELWPQFMSWLTS